MRRNRQRRTTVCREGWYFLLVFGLVFGGAVFREVNLLLLLAGMLAGPILLSWPMLSATLRGLRVERKLPHGVCAGDLLVGRVRLTNTRRRLGSWAVVVEEELRREGNGRMPKPARGGVMFPYVGADTTCEGTYRGRIARRGRYRAGPLKLSSRFPFGLLCRTLTIGSAETITVLPRLGRLTSQWRTLLRDAPEGTDRRRRHGAEGDFYGVRPWRNGDSRRWIHWRATARRGEPVVRQFEQARGRNVAVLVDLWQPSRPTPEQADNIELAISFAATVVADLCRHGGARLLVANTGQQPQLLAGPASAALLGDALHQLAEAEADDADRLDEVVRQAAGKITPGTEVVLIGTRPADHVQGDPVRTLKARVPGARITTIDASSPGLADYFEAE